jgi:hypothetical protein
MNAIRHREDKLVRVTLDERVHRDRRSPRSPRFLEHDAPKRSMQSVLEEAKRLEGWDWLREKLRARSR